MTTSQPREHPIAARIRAREEAGRCVLCGRPQDEPCEVCERAWARAAERWAEVFGEVAT